MGRCPDIVTRQVRTEGDVPFDRVIEQERLLCNMRNLSCELGPSEILHISAVHSDAALLGIPQPRKEQGQRGLARAGGSDDGDRTATSDIEIHIPEHELVNGVSERDRSTFESATAHLVAGLLSAVGDDIPRIEDRLHTLPGCR